MSWLEALRKRYSVTADPLRTQRRIELLAVALGILLCLQLAWGGVRMATLGLPDMVEPAADSMRIPDALSYKPVADNERDEIISRPLFWPSRRPVTVVAASGQAQPQKSDSKDLRGVKQVGVFGSGDDAGIIALVNGKKRRILLGEEINGWALESIGTTESEFANGGRRETLTLQRGTVTAAPNRAVKTTRRAQPTKQAGAKASRGAGAAHDAPAAAKNADEPAPKAVRDTDDSLSLGGGGSRR